MRREIGYWILLIVIVVGVIGYIVLSFADNTPEPIVADDLIATLPAQRANTGTLTTPATFEVVQAESVALFRTQYWALTAQTATGETQDISGTITVDTDDDALTINGTIRVDLRRLDSGNGQINRVMHDDILETETYEFANFTPESFTGLSTLPPMGTDVPFTMTGALTVRDITQMVTFDSVLRLVSAERVVISGVADVDRADFDLTAPEPFGSNIRDTVTIAFRFVGTIGDDS